MKVCVFVMKHILVIQEQMLELDGTSMKILRKTQNQPNTSETPLAIHFPGTFYVCSS